MTIRLSRAVLTPDGQIDITGWRAALLAEISVGRCDCGGPANGEPIILGRRVTWATAVCVRCGDNAALPVVPGASPLSAEQSPAGVPGTTRRPGAHGPAQRITAGQRRRMGARQRHR